MRALFLGIAFLLASLGVFFQWGESFELTTLDWRYQRRPSPARHSEIVIIEIGEDTLHRIGQWPIPRKWHTELIHALKIARVRSVLLNLLFLQPTEDDAALQQAMVEAGNVYLPAIAGSGFSEESLKSIEPLSAAAKGIGHANVALDRDGKVRRLPLEEAGFLAIPCLMSKEETRADASSVLPLDEKGNLLINFAGKWGETFRHYSFLEVIEAYAQEMKGEKGKFPLKELEGAVCFVGLTAAGTEQTLSIPMESHFPMIGVFANVYNMLLEKKWIRRADLIWRLTVAWLFLILGLAAPYFGKRLRAILILAGIGFGYFLVSWGFFAELGIWLDCVYPLALLGISGVVSLTHQSVIIQHQQEILQRELDVAYKIQQLLLPSPIPQTPGLSIAAKMIPARHIGGDFYDLVPCGNDSFAIMIGDVSGKGVPAALCMAMISNEFRTLIQRESRPSEVLKKLNCFLWSRQLKIFVTMTLLIYRESEGCFYYVNAGHLPILKAIRSRKEARFLDFPSGPPLGATPEADFPESRVPIEKEAVWFLYTDGITEAKDKAGEMFGEERFCQEAGNVVEKPVSEILEGLVGRAVEFQVGKDLSDDLTLLVVNSY